MCSPTIGPRHRHAGFTLAELLISGVMMVALSVATIGVMLRAHKAQTFVEKQLQVTIAAQDLIERLRGDVGSSLRLFRDDTEGNEYLAGLDRAAAPGLSGARLPRLLGAGGFGKDVVGGEKSGSVLMFAMHDRTDTFDLSLGAGEPRPFRTNVYRLVAFYLTKLPGKDVASDVDSLDMVRWVSPPLADLAQVETVVDPAERAALLRHLWAGNNAESPRFPYVPVRHVWRAGAVFADAFLEIASDGALVDVGAGWKVPADAKRTQQGILGFRKMAIAGNAAGPDRGVAAFALVDTGGDGFPHGFETQIIGPAGARQVLVHVTVVSQTKGDLKAWLDLSNVSETRDL